MADSFVLFTEHWSGMELLSLEQRGLLLTALMADHDACPMPQLDQTTTVVLAMMRPRMEANRKKYLDTVEKRRAAGKVGGKAKAGNATTEETNVSEQKQAEANKSKTKHPEANGSKAKQTEAKPSIAPPDTDTDPDPENTSYSNTPLTPQGDAVADAPAGECDAAPVPDASETAEPQALPEQPEPEPEPEPPAPAPSSRKEKPEKQLPLPRLRKDDFVRWYVKYPCKKNRGSAVKTWDKLAKAEQLPSLDALLSALDWQMWQPDWQKEDGQYVPHPASYLNAYRWTDEPPSPGQLQAWKHGGWQQTRHQGRPRRMPDPDQSRMESIEELPRLEDGTLDVQEYFRQQELIDNGAY